MIVILVEMSKNKKYVQVFDRLIDGIIFVIELLEPLFTSTWGVVLTSLLQIQKHLRHSRCKLNEMFSSTLNWTNIEDSFKASFQPGLNMCTGVVKLAPTPLLTFYVFNLLQAFSPAHYSLGRLVRLS